MNNYIKMWLLVSYAVIQKLYCVIVSDWLGHWKC